MLFPFWNQLNVSTIEFNCKIRFQLRSLIQLFLKFNIGKCVCVCLYINILFTDCIEKEHVFSSVMFDRELMSSTSLGNQFVLLCQPSQQPDLWFFQMNFKVNLCFKKNNLEKFITFFYTKIVSGLGIEDPGCSSMKCTFRLALLAYDFEHTLQTTFSTFAWCVRWCRVKLLLRSNTFPHLSQIKSRFFPECIFDIFFNNKTGMSISFLSFSKLIVIVNSLFNIFIN